MTIPYIGETRLAKGLDRKDILSKPIEARDPDKGGPLEEANFKLKQVCVGRNIAVVGLALLTTALLARYDIIFVDPETKYLSYEIVI